MTRKLCVGFGLILTGLSIRRVPQVAVRGVAGHRKVAGNTTIQDLAKIGRSLDIHLNPNTHGLGLTSSDALVRVPTPFVAGPLRFVHEQHGDRTPASRALADYIANHFPPATGMLIATLPPSRPVNLGVPPHLSSAGSPLPSSFWSW